MLATQPIGTAGQVVPYFKVLLVMNGKPSCKPNFWLSQSGKPILNLIKII